MLEKQAHTKLTTTGRLSTKGKEIECYIKKIASLITREHTSLCVTYTVKLLPPPKSDIIALIYTPNGPHFEKQWIIYAKSDIALRTQLINPVHFDEYVYFCTLQSLFSTGYILCNTVPMSSRRALSLISLIYTCNVILLRNIW